MSEAKAGTQTFLIECNRGNSEIDANAPTSNNGKWTTKTDFEFKRGDRVGVSAIMIESTGAGSQQQTIEFSGENVISGEKILNWTDDVVVLEFGFYVNNNAETTINLPLEFAHNYNNDYGTNLRINSGEWVNAADAAGGANTHTTYKYQYPGVAPPAGVGLSSNYDNGGYNFRVIPGLPTAYDVYQFLEIDGQPVVLPAFANTLPPIKSIVLSKPLDPNPTINNQVSAGELTIPLPQNYSMTGQNTPFAKGLGIAFKNAAGEICPFDYKIIESVEPNYAFFVPPALPVYDGRLRINLATPATIDKDAQANMQIIPVKPLLAANPIPPNTNPRPIRWGTSAGSANLPPIAPALNPTYEKGARLGIGLYNASAPATGSSAAATGFNNENQRLNGGAMLWEQTRCWGNTDATEIPQLGSTTATQPVQPTNDSGTVEYPPGAVPITNNNNSGRNMRTMSLKNYKDNRPYIMVSPEYQAPQPTPNGLGMCPELQPMTAYVVIRADSSFEDVNNLAQKFTEAFHAINPLVLGKGKDLEKYLDNQDFPYNNLNNTLPLTSTGYYTKFEGENSGEFNSTTAALYNRIEPLFIGNLLKCLPANLTPYPDWKNQPGNPYYYYPNDDKDYLKIGDQGNWNWNNLIYGNMGLANFNKCYSGDRFIRTTCWDGNTTNEPHRDIPRPVILNTQLIKKFCSQPAPPNSVGADPFVFSGAVIDIYQPIFTNIEFTDDNLDTIEECMRHSERYITERREYLPATVVDNYELQKKSDFWEYEMDIGMSRGDTHMNTNDINLGAAAEDGIMTRLKTNWIVEAPASANVGAAPSSNPIGTTTPSQSYPGNGGDVNIQQGREVGRMQVFSRFQDGWLTKTGVLGSPNAPLENVANDPLGSPDAFCQINTFGLNPLPLEGELMKKSQARNIGALPYIYNDEDGNQHVLTFFMSSKTYDPQTTTDFGSKGGGRSSWELGYFGWGDFFGFSPQYGYDQAAVIPVNADVAANQIGLTVPEQTITTPQDPLIIPQDDIITNYPEVPAYTTSTPQDDLETVIPAVPSYIQYTPVPDLETIVPEVPASSIIYNTGSVGYTDQLLSTDLNQSPPAGTNNSARTINLGNPIYQYFMTFTDDGGAGNYSNSNNRSLTFDSGAGNYLWVRFNSFKFEHSSSVMYDRAGITASDVVADLPTAGANLNTTTAPVLSPLLINSATTLPIDAWSASYGSSSSTNNFILPSRSDQTPIRGGNFAPYVGVWFQIKARYMRFWFYSDGSVVDNGWNIDVCVEARTPAVPSYTIYTPQPDQETVIPEVPSYIEYTPQDPIITNYPAVPAYTTTEPQDDLIVEQPDIVEIVAATDITPLPKWGWNNQNYVWAGANDAAMVFDSVNNRFTLSQLYTQKQLSAVSATIGTPTVPPTPVSTNETQLGEKYAGINTDYTGTTNAYLPTLFNRPKHYNVNNQGVGDSVCGVFLNNIYYAPKDWQPPTNINPKNLYNPGSNSYGNLQHQPDSVAPEFPLSTYSNLTTENRKQFLAPLTKATPENWTGNILDKMGFDYEQIIPPYGVQDNRYSAFTYGRTDIATMYEGTKPLIMNAETDTAADLDMSVFTYNAASNPILSTVGGTPLYRNGLLNNNPLNLGDMNSAKLIANRIPTLFACPFYLIISDICPTQFQSGSKKQDCIFYGLKNYGAGQYFYVFGSNYSQLVDTDRTITQVNTEIRNPLTGRLARLGKNSCIIYQVERDIELPAIEIDAVGQPIIQATPETGDQDEKAGMYEELKKLVGIQTGEKAELNTLVKADTGSHDVLTGIQKLMKKLNIHGKNRVGITDNMDFGGAIRKPDETARLSQEEAEKIVRDEIALEEAQDGMERKQGDIENDVRERAKVLMEGQDEGRRVDIDKNDLYNDLAKLVVEKALRTLPITTGTRDATIGNPAHIATAIRQSLQEFTPMLEELTRDVESGEITINDAIKTLEERNVFLSARGTVISRKRSTTKTPTADANYSADPQFIAELAEGWITDGGASIETMVRKGMEEQEIGITQGESSEPMDLTEIRRQRDDVVSQMKAYKAQNFQDSKLKKAGATPDMILSGRALAEQEAQQSAEAEMREYGDLPREEREKKYKELYSKELKEQNEMFSTNPLRYIREFGDAGQGVSAEKIISLQAEHKKAEEGVAAIFTGDHPKARRKAEPAEGKVEPPISKKQIDEAIAKTEKGTTAA